MSLLWFYLDDTLALAEHAATSTRFDTGAPDTLDAPALLLTVGDGLYLRSNGQPTCLDQLGTERRVYAQGAPASPAHRVAAKGSADLPAITSDWALDPDDPHGLLAVLRGAASAGCTWATIDITITTTGVDVVIGASRSLEAVVNTNARWVPATVTIVGVLGPYPAQIAHGYLRVGWLVPRFTRAVTDTIIGDVAARGAGRADGTTPVLRWSGDTVEVLTPPGPAGPDSGETTLVEPDTAGMYAIGTIDWCWQPPEDDVVPTPCGSDPAGCLCPRLCRLCWQPDGHHHDLGCPWARGSVRCEHPALAPQPRVTRDHTHGPGCPHAQPHPGGLFEPIDDANERCGVCGSLNTNNADTFDSFGGSVEHHERCTACGTTRSWCDMSAVL